MGRFLSAVRYRRTRHRVSRPPLPMAKIPRPNNLELLRLVFAGQVVLLHALTLLGRDAPTILRMIPGVPAFFFLSGMLIYASYLNSESPREYFRNRVLRLFPALIAVTAGALAIAVAVLGTNHLLDNLGKYLVWIVAQLTLGQAWSPQMFDGVGTGNLNGVLWTISIELCFYLAVPILVALQRKWEHAVAALSVLSFLVYAVMMTSDGKLDVLDITLLPWGWMFGAGILCLRHLDRVLSLGRWLLVGAAVMTLLGLAGLDGPLLRSASNRLGLLYFAAYVSMVVYLAFLVPAKPLSFDISYGIYIWHLPIINVLLINDLSYWWLACALVVPVAAASWTFIERPALRAKHRALRTY